MLSFFLIHDIFFGYGSTQEINTLIDAVNNGDVDKSVFATNIKYNIFKIRPALFIHRIDDLIRSRDTKFINLVFKKARQYKLTIRQENFEAYVRGKQMPRINKNRLVHVAKTAKLRQENIPKEASMRALEQELFGSDRSRLIPGEIPQPLVVARALREAAGAPELAMPKIELPYGPRKPASAYPFAPKSVPFNTEPLESIQEINTSLFENNAVPAPAGAANARKTRRRR